MDISNGSQRPYSLGAIYDHEVWTGGERKCRKKLKKKGQSKTQFIPLNRKFTSRKEEFRLHEEPQAKPKITQAARNLG